MQAALEGRRAAGDTAARASEPLSRAKKPTSRCKMPNISAGATERDVSAQCLPARLTVPMGNSGPSIQPKCTGGSSSLSPLSAAFFKVSDRKATADAAQEGTESLGAEARIYADRHPKLIDCGCITPVSAETRRLDASSRHRRRRLETPGSACDEGAVWIRRAVRATRAPSGHTGKCVRRTQDPG
jgi:hypothetical protein